MNPTGDRSVRVRMAPSPTGPLHIGTARTSLYNYLFARRSGGTFVLRIEDTDVARSATEYEADILEQLHWLGIRWDEGPQVAAGTETGAFGPYRQSRRFALYRMEADRLLQSGAAYRCYCTPEELDAVRREQEAAREAPRYNRRCLNLDEDELARFRTENRPAAIRFRVTPETIEFHDLIRGSVTFDNSLLGDFVIVRGDGVPLYHFCVVVDDEAMQISHVIRGEDHLSNTPKHIALIRALGYRQPHFGHIPLILNPDRSKMSKRKSQIAIHEYRAQGYLPEAIVNFLAFLGWSPGTEEEVFSLDELSRRFEIGRVQKAGAVFDSERLDHLNGWYIRSLHDEQLALRLRPFLPRDVDDASLLSLVPLIKERLVRLSDAPELVGFLFETDAVVGTWYAAELLLPKKRDAGEVAVALRAARQRLEQLTDPDWSADVLESRCRAAAEDLGWKAGDFFKPLRVAITGRTVSPPLFGSMELLGRERCLARIEMGLDKLAAGTPVS